LLDQDGTFDQLKPLNNLIKRFSLDPLNGGSNNQMFYSFDLSAATDRLPIDLQIQILNLLRPKLGSL